MGSARVLTEADLKGPREPALSYSTAADMLNWSPRYAHHYNSQLGGHSKRTTNGMRLGTLADALLLDRADKVRLLEYDDWKKKASREERDELLAQGLLPTLARDFEPAMQLVKSVTAILADFGILLDGVHQLPLEWREEAVGGAIVTCRGVLDHWHAQTTTIYDLKAVADPRPHKVQRSAIEFGHDIQAASYISAIEHWKPELEGRVRFVDLYCYTGEPVDVVPIEACGSFIDLGRMRWNRAKDTWARCMANDVWPGIANRRIIPGEAPAYAMQREYEEQGL